jgi:hypothetical protein
MPLGAGLTFWLSDQALKESNSIRLAAMTAKREKRFMEFLRESVLLHAALSYRGIMK